MVQVQTNKEIKSNMEMKSSERGHCAVFESALISGSGCRDTDNGEHIMEKNI